MVEQHARLPRRRAASHRAVSHAACFLGQPGTAAGATGCSGGRAALSGKVLKDFGYTSVFNLGAFKDWVESGGAVDKA